MACTRMQISSSQKKRLTGRRVGARGANCARDGARGRVRARAAVGAVARRGRAGDAEVVACAAVGARRAARAALVLAYGAADAMARSGRGEGARGAARTAARR